MSAQFYIKFLFVVVIVALLSCIGCVSIQDNGIIQPTPTIKPPILTTVVGNVGGTSEIIECSLPPKGMVVRINLLAENEIRVDVEGLEVGEHPILEMRTTVGNRTRILTAQNNETVAQDGKYTFIEPFESVRIAGHSTWVIRIIHQRGIYCVTMNL